jgi:hypothetical protein
MTTPTSQLHYIIFSRDKRRERRKGKKSKKNRKRKRKNTLAEAKCVHVTEK